MNHIDQQNIKTITGCESLQSAKKLLDCVLMAGGELSIGSVLRLGFQATKKELEAMGNLSDYRAVSYYKESDIKKIESKFRNYGLSHKID